jgi:hypothetical protein
MSWQKCPVCNGKGISEYRRLASCYIEVCSTCNGQKIINELTGHPPAPSTKITIGNTTDFLKDSLFNKDAK